MASRSNHDRRALARPTATLVAAVLICAATLLCAAGSALAATPSPPYKEALDGTVRFLQNSQNMDGGFSREPGASPDPDTSAWAALGLAAAGINPQDQASETDGAKGTSVYDYLSAHATERTSTLELERELLVVDASGTSPNDFGGVNLVGDILGRRVAAGEEGAFAEEPGESTAYVNATVFAILALGPIDEAAVQEAVQRAAQWLIAAQSKEGGWPAHAACRPSEECQDNVDMTGAAIEALNTAGLRETPAQTKAFEYLHSAQDANGGFPQQAGEDEPNVASTAWAVQGILSAGENPETWVKDADEPTDEPLGYMASLQQPDGSMDYKAGEQSARVWMTAYVLSALAGQSLPIPPVPRSVASTAASPSPETATASAPSATSPGSAEAGHGGESTHRGSGAIAGGGGNGAALFSRPQPQSKGETPGGARGLEHAEEQPSKSARAPGRKREAPGRGQGQEVRGVLIDAPASAIEPVAPGLRSAGAGGEQAPWLAIAIGGLVVLLFLGGAQLERKRPQAIL